MILGELPSWKRTPERNTMTKLRNAVLAGALTLGIGGAGLLAAAPAYAAAPVVTPGGGNLVSATGTAGQTLDMALTGPVWNFSPSVEYVRIDVTVPDGTRPVNQQIIMDGLRYTIYHLAAYPANVWRIAVDSPTGGTISVPSLSIPTFKIAEITPGALQGTVSYDLYQVGLDGANEDVTGEFQPSATFTWTDDQPDTPVIAPAIGGAAAIAGIGLAGIVLVRRRRHAEQA